MHELKIFQLISWISLPTVMFGGYSLLGAAGDKLTDTQRALFRAGHAHAGVLLILSLVYELQIAALSIARLGVAAPAARRPLHARVRRVLRHLRTLPDGADTSLPALAEVAQLSPSRLMHAFTASIGIPLRPYLAWLRLQRAAGEITRGTPLSLAAASSGFSDAAHMSRTFRRMLGMAPSMLQPARVPQTRARPDPRRTA